MEAEVVSDMEAAVVSEMGAKAAGCGLTEAERESNSETTHREPKNAQKFTKHQSNPSPNVVCVVPATINTALASLWC